MTTNGTSIRLSEAVEERLDKLVKQYPNTKSAVMPALHMAQQERGWLDDEAIVWVSERLKLPRAHVISVATFYSMYHKKPVGKYNVQVCRTLSCMLCGARGLTARLRERFGVAAHEVTADGMWSYEEVECLGSCGTGAMVQINDVYFENLTPEKLDAVLDEIEREKPDLKFSDAKQRLGTGLSSRPRSQAW